MATKNYLTDGKYLHDKNELINCLKSINITPACVDELIKIICKYQLFEVSKKIINKNIITTINITNYDKFYGIHIMIINTDDNEMTSHSILFKYIYKDDYENIIVA